MDIREKLKSMQAVWNQGRMAATTTGIPDGVYMLQLKSASLRMTELTRKLYISREHLIVDGEYTGQTIRDMLFIETERGPFFVSQWIKQMGFEVPENSEDLEEVVDAISLCSPVYIGIVKHSGEYVNVRIKEVISTGSAQGPVNTVNTFSIGDYVEFKNDKQETDKGVIISFNDDKTEEFIRNDNNDMYSATINEIKLISSDSAEFDKASLIALAEAYGVEGITEEYTLQDIQTKLNEYEWFETNLTPHEIELLKKYSIEVKKSVKTPVKKKA